jgi:hypothetical protein
MTRVFCLQLCSAKYRLGTTEQRFICKIRSQIKLTPLLRLPWVMLKASPETCVIYFKRCEIKFEGIKV